MYIYIYIYIYIYVYIYIYIYIYVYIYIYTYAYTYKAPKLWGPRGPEAERVVDTVSFQNFKLCFCGLGPGNLKFETVRTHRQRICF